MRALTAGELLDIWEAGFAQTPAERALTLLTAACPETSWDALAALSIGQRDARLLALRERLWGAGMEAVVACPGCRDRLELNLSTRAMLEDAPPFPPGEMTLNIAEYKMIFRLPTSLDVMAAAEPGDAETCRALLLERCLLAARQGDEPVDSYDLPPEITAGIAEAMVAADPLADIQLDLTCPTCEQRWRGGFDIVSFLWTEIEVWAWRMLSDVHTLARAYGWSEGDILRLSPTRRQFYLEMCGTI
jgi:hypothetical protein